MDSTMLKGKALHICKEPQRKYRIQFQNRQVMSWGLSLTLKAGASHILVPSEH